MNAQNCASGATNLAFQSFEGGVGENWTYTSTPVLGASVFPGSPSDQWEILSTITNNINATDGSSFVYGRDLKNNDNTGGTATLSFDNVNVLNETGVVLTFDYETIGFDSTDKIEYVLYLDDVAQAVQNVTGSGTNTGTASICIPDGTINVRLDVIITQNGGSDYFGLDNFNICSGSNSCASVVITEVMVNPCSGADDKYWPDSGAVGDGEKEGEWVEFYNPSSSSIDISGYVVKDGASEVDPYFVFPTGTTIGANEYFVVGSTNVIAKMTSVPTSNKFDKGSNTKELDNAGEDVTIENASGQELDRVVWTAGNCGTTNNGLSLTLMTPEVDLGTVDNENTDTAPWYVSLNGGNDPVGGGTPGAPNDAGACISNFTATAPTSCPADCSTGSFSIEVSFDYARAYVTEYDILLNGNTYAITGLAQGSGSVTNQIISVPCNSITSGNFDVEIRPKGASSANKCMTNIVSITIPSCSASTDICNNFPAGGIYITEILVNPTGSEDCEYIELYNAYADPVSLSGWSVDGLGTTISSSSEFRIEPGEYVLVSNKTRNELNTDCGFNIPANVQVIVDTTGSLTNTGEDIEILPISDCETVNHTANYNYGDVSSTADEGKAIYFTYGANGAISAQTFGSTTPGEGSCTSTTDTVPACKSTCTAALEPGVVQCETATPGADTYTATWILEFGIENSVFTVSIPSTSSGTIKSEDVTIDPTVDTSPYIITVMGIPEGTPAQLNVTNVPAGGYCDLNSLNEISSPNCSGCDVQPCLVITEIMIDPCSGSSSSSIWAQEGHGEYVEILNNCAVDVNISGYQLRDELGTSNYAIFPNGSIIAAGERLVVGSATVINALKVSDLTNATKYYLKGGIGGFGGDNAELDNSTPDGLRLVSCLGDEIDAVDWANPSCITGNDGISAVLMDVTADNSNINTANWYPTLNGGQSQAQGGGGTPLAANDAGACISDPIFSNIQCPADCTAVDAKISFDISFDYLNSYGTEFDIYFDDAKLTTVSIPTGTPPYNGTYTGTLEIDCSSAIAGIRPVEVRVKDALANACSAASADIGIPNCTATPNTCAADATLIAIENFDSGTPSWSNNASNSYFSSRDSGEGLGISSSNGNNTKFAGNTLYGQDLDQESGDVTVGTNPNGEINVTFTSIDITAYRNVALSFDYAARGNAETGSYVLIFDGVEQPASPLWNDPDTAVSGSVTESISDIIESVGLKLIITGNGGSDFFEVDNFQLCGVLAASQPVDLTKFMAIANDQDVDLTWETASETKNSHFILDRSFDGVHFQAIGQVTAEEKAASYTFKDINVASQSTVVYYRLNQVDDDGSSSYSNIVQAEFNHKNDYTVYPNPVKNSNSFTIEGKSINTVDVYNSVGQLVASHHFGGLQTVTLLTNKLAKGVYLIKVNHSETQRLSIQ